MIYGAGGSIGSAVARAFTRDGVKAFVAGMTATAVSISCGVIVD